MILILYIVDNNKDIYKHRGLSKTTIYQQVLDSYTETRSLVGI